MYFIVYKIFYTFSVYVCLILCFLRLLMNVSFTNSYLYLFVKCEMTFTFKNYKILSINDMYANVLGKLAVTYRLQNI